MVRLMLYYHQTKYFNLWNIQIDYVSLYYKLKVMKTVYFLCSLLMIGMLSYSFQEYPMLVGFLCFGIGIGYMREKNKI
jgi:hypothetical protein